MHADGRFFVVHALDEGRSKYVVDVLAVQELGTFWAVAGSVLYFAEVCDHLGEYVDTAVSDDLVLCDEPLEEELEETRDETGRGGVVVVVLFLCLLG